MSLNESFSGSHADPTSSRGRRRRRKARAPLTHKLSVEQLEARSLPNQMIPVPFSIDLGIARGDLGSLSANAREGGGPLRDQSLRRVVAGGEVSGLERR